MGRVGEGRGEIKKKKHPAKKRQEIHAQRARHKEHEVLPLKDCCTKNWSH